MADRSDGEVSKTAAVSQENGASSASAASSEGTQAAQEQKPEGATAQQSEAGESQQQGDLAAQMEQKIREAEERVRREEQSKRDRQLHQLQMQIEADRRQREEESRKAEEARLKSLDDEDYGREMRKRTEEAEEIRKRQAAAQEADIAMQRQEFQETLEEIPAENRDDFLKRVNEETHNIKEFRKFTVNYMAELKAKKLAEKLAEQSAKAMHNDSTARQAELAAPVVTTGNYQQSSKPLSIDEMLSQGIDEALARERKRRGA